MKTAPATVMAIELTCPHCGEAISCPKTGSFLLGEEELRKVAHWVGPEYDGTALCEGHGGCYKRFKLPAVVRKILE